MHDAANGFLVSCLTAHDSKALHFDTAIGFCLHEQRPTMFAGLVTLSNVSRNIFKSFRHRPLPCYRWLQFSTKPRHRYGIDRLRFAGTFLVHL
jgi:hypothetical protein